MNPKQLPNSWRLHYYYYPFRLPDGIHYHYLLFLYHYLPSTTSLTL